MTKESDSIAPTIRSDQTLKQAMRAARLDDAERLGVQADLRAAQIARLEMLQEALKPLLTQVPDDAADLFDVGLMPGATPRLFVDMIGFVEMGRDTRVYRLLQDTRHARLCIEESASVPTMVDAITQYVARRLLEREKALAADITNGGERTPVDASTDRLSEGADERSGSFRWAAIALAFVIDLLGAVTFFALLVAAGWYVWNRLHGRL